MSRVFRLALLKRFFKTVRDDGLGEALRKTRVFLAMRMRGWAPSILGGAGLANSSPGAALNGVWSEIARGGGFHVNRSLENGARVALIGDLNLPQCRKYRVEQLAELLEALGIGCEFAHFEDEERSIGILQHATHLCEYRLLNTPLTQMYRYEARRLGLPVLYDIDDPLFSVSAYETYRNMTTLDPALKAHFISEAPKYATMMNGADVVSVSTPGLAEHAALFTKRPVFTRRNFADLATLADGASAMAGRSASDGMFRLVFASGSQGHEADFDLLKGPVGDFVTASPDRRLLLLAHFHEGHLSEPLRAQTEMRPFSTYQSYLAALARADVAVMPLQDDIFNRCKSAVRVIDAASVGLPVIVSDIGDLDALVDDGRTGFVAHDQADWRQALERLVAEPNLRETMGQAARSNLEDRWCVQNAPHIISPQMVEWLRK